MHKPRTAIEVWRLAVAFEARLAAELAELDLTVAAFRLVGEVSQAPDGLRQGELARRLGVSAPTVSAAVSRLQRDGLLVRRPDPDDPRARRVCLAEGADLTPGLAVLSRLEGALVAGMAPAQQDAAGALLATLIGNLQPAEQP